MRILIATLLCLTVSAGATDAQAQDLDTAFTGPHLGAAVTATNHHFVAIESNATGIISTANVGAWGVGGEGFAGYDLRVSPRLRIGGEAQVEFGGRTAQTITPDFSLGIDPRYGWSVTGRLGYVVTPKAMVYAGLGYGTHYYRTIASGAATGDGFDRNSSFILRGGMEYRLSKRAGVRLEFEHLDGTRNQFALGIPIRF